MGRGHCLSGCAEREIKGCRIAHQCPAGPALPILSWPSPSLARLLSHSFALDTLFKQLNVIFYHSMPGILFKRNLEDYFGWLERLIKCLAGGRVWWWANVSKVFQGGQKWFRRMCIVFKIGISSNCVFRNLIWLYNVITNSDITIVREPVIIKKKVVFFPLHIYNFLLLNFLTIKFR